ncbi:hypothetical protein ACKFKF_19485 [Phormidesmis sp. 146-12]
MVFQSIAMTLFWRSLHLPQQDNSYLHKVGGLKSCRLTTDSATLGREGYISDAATLQSGPTKNCVTLPLATLSWLNP